MGYASGPNLPYGAKMEYAKRAALAVVEQLGPRDLVGAIAFDSEPYELSPLLPLAEATPRSRRRSASSSTAAARTSRRRSTARGGAWSPPAAASATSSC